MHESELHVQLTSEGWVVQPMNEVFDTQQDALLAATQQAQQHSQEVIIHETDGQAVTLDQNAISIDDSMFEDELYEGH